MLIDFQDHKHAKAHFAGRKPARRENWQKKRSLIRGKKQDVNSIGTTWTTRHYNWCGHWGLHWITKGHFDEIAQMTKTICELKKGLRVSGRRTAQKLNQMISQKKVNPPNVTPNNSKHDQPDPEVLDLWNPEWRAQINGICERAPSPLHGVLCGSW